MTCAKPSESERRKNILTRVALRRASAWYVKRMRYCVAQMGVYKMSWKPHLFLQRSEGSGGRSGKAASSH
eukprot:5351089-Amphidinium_carterae.1